MAHRSPLRTSALGLSLLVAACGDDGSTPSQPDTDGSTSDGTGSGTSSSGSTLTTTGSSSESSSTDAESSSGGSTGGGTTGSSETGQPTCDADVIELPGEAFYPEGVAANGDSLYVGSIATGEIVRASMCDGSTEPFVDGTEITAAVGLRVDADRGVLWVCNSDSTFAMPPSIDVFDLDGGDRLAQHVFEDPGFCNDLVLDDAGNLYATDSGAARIVQVAAADALADTSVVTWSADALYAVPPGEFGLNGIVWDPTGVLQVANFFDGRVYEVAIENDGSAGAITVLGETGTLAGPDGMLRDAGALLVVEGGAQRLSRLDPQSLDLEVEADGFDFPTTVALDPTGEYAWVAEGQFDHLFGLDPAPPDLPFVVVRVELN